MRKFAHFLAAHLGDELDLLRRSVRRYPFLLVAAAALLVLPETSIQAQDNTVPYPGDSGQTGAETKLAGLEKYASAIGGWVILIVLPIAAIWAAVAGKYALMWGFIIGSVLLFFGKFLFGGLHDILGS